MPMTLKAVLFDHDGTLVDSEGVHWRHWQQVLKQYALELSESEYKAHFPGIPTSTRAQELVQQYRLAVSPQELARQKNETTRTYLTREAFPLMPYACEAISLLAGKGLKLGVVTGAGPDAINVTLATFGLSDIFSTVVTGADVRHSKPAPDCYLLALERLGLRAEECLAVEDTEHGIQAAGSAGIPCCAIPNAFSSHHDFSRALRSFPDLYSLARWISQAYARGDDEAVPLDQSALYRTSVGH